MTLVSPAQLMEDANHGRGVAAFNLILIEQLEAFVDAAEHSSSGLILQLSQNAAHYHGDIAPIGTAVVRAAQRASVPIAVQLDHADDLALIAEAVDLGFTSVMFDGSHLEHRENAARTAAVAEELHRSRIWVEAELGEIGGKDGVHSAIARTDPQEAARFVAETGVDGLAVAVGSSHAMADRTAVIDLDLIRRIRGEVDVPLVLHGSSGVADDLIRGACAAGIRKVNVGTLFNSVLTQTIRQHLENDAEVLDPRAYMGRARDAVTAEASRLLAAISGR